jgi:hypothetical protein
VGQQSLKASKIKTAIPLVKGITQISLTKVHKLLVFWGQLVLINFAISGYANELLGAVLGIASLGLIIPFSIIISRLVSKNQATGLLIGVLFFTIFEAFIAYNLMDRWAVKYAILYGAFYGLSLPNYFSADDRYTNIFRALGGTFILVICLDVVVYKASSVGDIIDTIGHLIRGSLHIAVFTIALGLLVIPVRKPLRRTFESWMDEIYKPNQIDE